MTFTNIQSGDPLDANVVMNNFKHGNYGNPLLPVNSSGVSVDNTIELGSSTKRWANVYANNVVQNYGKFVGATDFKLSMNSSGYLQILDEPQSGPKSIFPSGFIMPTMSTLIPYGFLYCNGQAVSRILYSELFTAIGTNFGAGNGSTTFNVPDLRGYFLRGQDDGAGRDPDSTDRTNRGDGTSGDNIGTKQNDEYKSHNHGVLKIVNNSIGEFINPKISVGTPPAFEKYIESSTPDKNINYSGGEETRPKNIYVRYLIAT